jgi:hypothetical protein
MKIPFRHLQCSFLNCWQRQQNSPAAGACDVHIVYASSALQPFTTSELQGLLEQARPKKSTLAVTGMLLYKDGNFMEVLEGEEEAVTNSLEPSSATAGTKEF